MKIFKAILFNLWITVKLANGLPFNQETSAFISKYNISGINLDLISINDTSQLDVEIENYSNNLKQIQIMEASQDNYKDQKKIIDFDGPNYKITKYFISKRDKFNSKKMEYIINKNPKSVVLFKDTRTILVPDYEDVLRHENDYLRVRVAGGDTLKYNEYDIGPSINYNVEPVLIPATPCLKFLGNDGSGSIRVSYKVGVDLFSGSDQDNSLDVPTGSDSISLALNYLLNSILTKSASFMGTYTCNTEQGKAVRLFYKVGTIGVKPKKRGVFYNMFKNTIVKDDWMQLRHVKYLTDSVPMYYCITEDHMDLRCNEPGVEYIDENGNTIRTIIQQSEAN